MSVTIEYAAVGVVRTADRQMTGPATSCRVLFITGGIQHPWSQRQLLELQKHDVIRNIQPGNLLLISVAKPDTGFNVIKPGG